MIIQHHLYNNAKHTALQGVRKELTLIEVAKFIRQFQMGTDLSNPFIEARHSTLVELYSIYPSYPVDIKDGRRRGNE